MTQHARATGLASIVQAAGDVIVYGGEEPYRWASWPAPAVPEARAQPSELLRAANALVGFTGRDALIAWLREWRDGDATLAVHLIHGVGGQGKTRLAHRVARLWQGEGWVVLAAHHRRDRSVPAEFEVPDFDGAAGVLVVVDYAERWETADLLTLLADVRARGGLAVRVLLLARPAGTWWQSLKGRIQRDMHLVPTREELAPLEQESGITRGGLFTEARDRFAELLQVPGADGVAPPPALERHEAYRLVLTVHMAALAAVLAHDRGHPSPADPVQVSELLLARERDHWEAMSTPSRDTPLATTADTMGQVVYTATLTGRLGYVDGKAALERASVDSALAAGQLLKDHAVCYPPAGTPGPAHLEQRSPAGRGGVTVLEPLYPDRLGEDYLALCTPGHSFDFPADPWAEEAPARLLAPPDGDQPAQPGDGVAIWVRQGLTTLIEASRRWPHLATTQLYPLLSAHPHLALHAGGAALAALAELETIDTTLLEAIESVLPAHRHIDLDIGIAAVADRLAKHRLAATDDPVTRARIHEGLAVRLSYAGLHARALTEGRQATQLWDHLVRTIPYAYLPELAGSLINHAGRLADVGRRADAVVFSEAAVGLYRELVSVDRDAYLPELAGSLIDHAVRLAEVGRRSEALALSHQAVDLWRELVSVNRNAYLPNLANSLTLRAVGLAEVGRGSEALALSHEAVDLRRELVSVNRDAYLPDLANSVHNHAVRLAEVGRQAEALTLSEEALHLRRELVSVNRDAYLPDLALTLTNHANRLAEEGRAEAVIHSQEALDLYRELVSVNRDAYLPNLANSVHNHANRLTEEGRQAEALTLSEEALHLRRELVSVNRDAYLPNLANSLTNHANRLAAVGRAEAVSLSQEAVDLYRELVSVNQDAYLPGLATSLHNHALRLRELGRLAEAVTIFEEAVGLYGHLMTVNRDAYVSDYAGTLAVLGYLLIEVERFREAVEPLLTAFVATHVMPEYAGDKLGTIVELLRRSYAGDAGGVSEMHLSLTGEDVPEWMKHPPSDPAS
ncbi:tetratricopeptide repeat protein [Sphaerisporangium fuscum]|uniref:tetratricopeptide repeat protein n=1 Tax=Sphaerisporangium fuscum TaxID=2835868 RepID=UPI001BDBEFB0|nr:tetratricopeptide repeat protein [Sphaerisporangium fuscum]